MSTQQPELPLHQDAPDATRLRSHLALTGWQTRKQLAEHFGWSERQLRLAAEALGPDVIRGQAGFKLTAALDRSDLPIAQQASDAFISQGKRMIRYGLAIRRKLHAIIG